MYRKFINKYFSVTALLLGQNFFRRVFAVTWGRGVVKAFAFKLRQRVFSLTEIWPSAYPWCGLSSNFWRLCEYLDILCLRFLLHLMLGFFVRPVPFHPLSLYSMNPPPLYFVLIIRTCCTSRVFNWLTSSVCNHTQLGWGVATIRLDEWGEL